MGLEPIDENIMNRKPIDSKKGLFGDGLWGNIFVQGLMIGMLTLLSFTIGRNLYSLKVGRAMAFVSLSMLELVHSFNIRSEESIFKTGIFGNKYLLGAFLLGTVLQVTAVLIEPIARIFDVVPLNNVQWLIVGIISTFPIIIMELQKKINELRFGKRVYLRKSNI